MFNEAFAGTLPTQGTDVATRWDLLYNFLVGLSAFFFVLIVGGMIYFAFKYRHRAGIKTKYITGNHVLESIFVVVPTILLLGIFAWGYSIYRDMTTPPSDAMEIHVIGKQWLWQFQYENGKTTIGEVFVPLNKPVKLVMTSQDVLHSVFIPSFRIKQDVVPGMYTSLWFEAKIPGRHQLYCTEYCGTSHSGMLAQVVVLDDQQWKDWNAGKKLPTIHRGDGFPDLVQTSQSASSTGGEGSTLAELGKKQFETKGCVACHSVDGSPKVGPSLKGVFGHKVELVDGKTVDADENYIRESIELPAAKVVKGFPPSMPTFKGLLSEEEMNAVIAYIKSLK